MVITDRLWGDGFNPRAREGPTPVIEDAGRRIEFQPAGP